MKKYKRGFWFITKSIFIGLCLLGFIGSICYFISLIFESDPNLQNDFSVEIFVYSIIACLCFTIAIIGLLKMVVQLRRVGYFIFVIGLIVGDIDYIIYIIRLGEKMPNLSNNGITFIILASIIFFTFILLLIPEFKSKLYRKKDLPKDELESIENQPAIRKENHLLTLISEHKKIVISSIVLLMLIAFFLVYLPTKCSRDRKISENNRIFDSIRVADSIAMVNAEMQRISDSIAANKKNSNQTTTEENSDNPNFSRFKELIEAKYPGISDRFNLEFFNSKGEQNVNGYKRDGNKSISFIASYEKDVIIHSEYIISNDTAIIIKFIKKSIWEKIFADFKKKYQNVDDFFGVSILTDKEKTSYEISCSNMGYLYNSNGVFIKSYSMSDAD